MTRALHIFSVALITMGIVFLTDAGLTLVWKEPLSAIYASVQQGEAADELEDVRRGFLALPEVAAEEDENPTSDPLKSVRRLADIFSEQTVNGEAIGSIEIPSIGSDNIFVEGTDKSDLQRGPGRYPDTALPGQGRTIGIAGHRTTYGAPFHEIDDVEVGDRITLDMPYAVLTYEVTETKIVEPTMTEIVDDVGRERLVLTACHPLYSAAQRYAVFADLESVELASASAT